MRLILTTALLLSSSLPGVAEMITKSSPHSVSETTDRLEAAVEGAGATVFARVDHAAGAEKIGAELRPTQMLMFGNPKIGTPAIQASQTSALDLPLRVVIFENEDGSVSVAYHEPVEMVEVHGIDADAPVLANMTGALGKLTDAAIAE